MCPPAGRQGTVPSTDRQGRVNRYRGAPVTILLANDRTRDVDLSQKDRLERPPPTA
jgi:hypothetical protein